MLYYNIAMDLTGAIIAAIGAQVLGWTVDKLGLRPHFQYLGEWAFFLAGAFILGGMLYFSWICFNPWGEVQAGLKADIAPAVKVSPKR